MAERAENERAERFARNRVKIWADCLLAALLSANLAVMTPWARAWLAPNAWTIALREGLQGGLAGAVADWFAVTALFRRPWGLPLPHTDIIARSQAELADKAATAVTDYFLSDDAIHELATRLDIVRSVRLRLESPQALKSLARFVATWRGNRNNSSGRESRDGIAWDEWAASVQREYAPEIVEILKGDAGSAWKIWKRGNWSSWIGRFALNGRRLPVGEWLDRYFSKGYGADKQKRDLRFLRALLMALARESGRSQGGRRNIERSLRHMAARAAPSLRRLCRNHVRDVVMGWDARHLSARMEGLLGGQLSYIRINSTGCGFLVGLALGLLGLAMR